MREETSPLLVALEGLGGAQDRVLAKVARLEAALDLILGTATNDGQQAGEEELKARMAAIAHTARTALGV